MNTFLLYLADFFRWIVTTSMMASALVIFILVVKFLFKDKLEARWQYGIWFLLILKLIMPWAPESSWSLFNLFSVNGEEAARTTQDIIIEQSDNYTSNQGVAMIEETISNAGMQQLVKEGDVTWIHFTSLPAVLEWLSVIWIIGVFSLAAYTYVSSRRFTRQVVKGAHIEEQRKVEILEECKKTMSIRMSIPLLKTDRVATPTLFGIINPKLLLPEKKAETFSNDELKHIFFHELSHCKRKDIAVNWIMSCLLILHWFNPLLWYAYYRMREDQEIACDALALSYLGPREVKGYGYTMIKLIEGFSDSFRLPTVASFSGNKSQLKRRITMITLFKQHSARWSVLGAAVIILLGSIMLTDAKGENWEISPLFTLQEENGEGKNIQNPLRGIEGKYGILDVPLFAGQVQKGMFYFFGGTSGKTEQLFNKPVTVRAISKDASQEVIVFSTSTGVPNPEIIKPPYQYAQAVTGISLPSKGLWRLEGYVDNTFFGSLVVDVKEKNAVDENQWEIEQTGILEYSDVPLYPGLKEQNGANDGGLYFVKNTTVEDIEKFYDKSLPSLGWKKKNNMKKTYKYGEDQLDYAMGSVWVKDNRMLRLSLYQYVDGTARAIFENENRRSIKLVVHPDNYEKSEFYPETLPLGKGFNFKDLIPLPNNKN